MGYLGGSGGNVHANFEELQDFQNVLQQNIERFRDIDSRTKGTLNSYVWDDKVAIKFKEDFDVGMKPIIKLTEEMDRFIGWLEPKKQALIKYIGG